MTLTSSDPLSQAVVPGFLVIGAMRSGTTTLWTWLRAQPELFLPGRKELNFFSSDHNWERGFDWYRSFFSQAAAGQLLGEVSPSYTNHEASPKAALRISSVNPQTRLVFLLRHPIERAQSHFRFRVQTGQERRSLLEALGEPGNSYISRSRYWLGLVPYTQLFPREQILVVRLDDLIDPRSLGWFQVLDHLGVPHRPPPGTAKNVTANKRQLRKTTSWARSRNLLRYYKRYPAPLRRAAGLILTKKDAPYEAQLEDSKQDLPADLTGPLWEDLAELEKWLGKSLWTKST